MLACPQEIFFHNDTSLETQQMNYNGLINNPNVIASTNDFREREEQVWPSDVEEAFTEALETIPKLGRRKILVNGKPCGRNELISDFIYQKTGKVRTRKQVSSHIQVLKNTRKNDFHFMRLLTDSVEVPEDIMPTSYETFDKPMNGSFPPMESFSSSDESSCSSSPNDYMLDMISRNPIQQQIFPMFKELCDPLQPIYSDFINFDPLMSTDPLFDSLAVMHPSEMLLEQQDIPYTSESPFWPSYICLYLEYTLPYDPCTLLTYNLAQMPHCFPDTLPHLPLSKALQEKCPSLGSLPSDTTTLLAKVRLDLGLDVSEFMFNNTSFFETSDRKTIECTTTIYSFGNVVLESKESQQSLWLNKGKHMYNFVFVNQFFDAFIKGLLSLQSWEEVDIAISNLCIVQTFEDVEIKMISPQELTPSLVMVYEFERGDANIEVSCLNTNKSLDFK
ncbi:hypothetical protein G6F56_005930 [Rhizopus delemar]|uniref:TEA domain-containing protein n=1 Tax=Rhizopus stolonifer TaxID=4846 RepID=A0A367KKK0_RHIST|nr:hypothetical protein G6F56_005930 [Rhizopus delemar]RCI02726.1 hypothetical protein CU098_004160 [Rhizopus stolonifer]